MNILRKGILVKLLILVTALTVFGQTEKPVKLDVKNTSDEDLILKFGSSNCQESTKATIELFRKGEKSIPLLMKLKNNKSISTASCLGGYFGADFIIDGVGGESSEDGSAVTVDVAALYLISAIYYDNLAFANLPYLIGSEPVTDFQYNTPERVEEAWKATEKWYKKLEKDGLPKLREDKEFPLKSTDLKFYGTNPQRKRDSLSCEQ